MKNIPTSTMDIEPKLPEPKPPNAKEVRHLAEYPEVDVEIPTLSQHVNGVPVLAKMGLAPQQPRYDYLNDTHCRAFCMAIAQGLKEACREQNGSDTSEDQK